MRISKNSFLNKIPFLCIILKNDVFEVNSFVLYWKMTISKNSFQKNVIFLCIILKNDVLKSQFFCFCIEKWGMRISKNSFRKNFAFLCIILKNEVFEVNSFVLYWKMRISKNSSWKNSILMYYIEKWCFRGQFFCFVLKNEEWEFLKILSEKMSHSYVLYWKMRFLKSILLFYIEKW